jgi:hypothetical protein
MGAAVGDPVRPGPSGDERPPEQTIGALGKVESSVPGRTRLRLKPELRTPEAVAQVKERLQSHPDVGDVSVNPRTGSVVVVHARHRGGEAIAAEALREAEFLAAAVFDLPDAGEEGGEDRFGKLDQQLADLVYRVDYAVWRKTGLRFRGQLLSGGIAGLGLAQIALFGISLEMLPGPLLLWIAWDIYHRVSQEPPYSEANADATPPPGAPASGGEVPLGATA